MENKFLSLLLFFIAIGLIWRSSYVSEYLPSEENDFQFFINPVNPSENIKFNRFNLTYDFTKNKGTLSFYIVNEHYLNDITVYFPKKIINSNVELRKCEGHRCVEESSINFKNESKKNTLTIAHFSEKIDDNLFLITFGMDIKPNGLFDFIYSKNNINGEGIHFILGRKYSCTSNCISQLENSRIHRYNDLKNIRIRLEGGDDSIHSRFVLNTIDNDKLLFKNLLFGLGVSFMASSIILFFGKKGRNEKGEKKMKEKKEFMQEVLRFLKLLEDNFGKSISIRKLKEEFKEDYNRIVEYLTIKRRGNGLIVRRGNSYRLNVDNLEQTRKFISDLSMEKLKETGIKTNALLYYALFAVAVISALTATMELYISINSNLSLQISLVVIWIVVLVFVWRFAKNL